MAKAPTIAQLAEEIFGLVEYDQGKAFISDGIEASKSRRELFAVVRGSLKHSEIVVTKTRAFLRKYGQL
jgi:hypothetical protein